MELPVYKLKRLLSNENGTCGAFLKSVNNRDSFICSTLEPKEVECIPIGEYEVECTYSPKFKKNLFEVKNVANKIGIRFHAGNSIDDTKGCILVGSEIKNDILYHGKKYKYWLTSSQACLSYLLKNLPTKFKLIIC